MNALSQKIWAIDDTLPYQNYQTSISDINGYIFMGNFSSCNLYLTNCHYITN